MTYDLDRLSAEEDIKALLFAYCDGIDTGQLDDTARLFSDGTWYLNADTPLSGFEAVSSFLKDNVILYDGVPATRHTVTNIRIQLSADRRTAHADSYVIVFQSVPGAAPHIMFQGAYDDTFEYGADGWHFDERRILTDGTGDMTLHLKGAEVRAVGV